MSGEDVQPVLNQTIQDVLGMIAPQVGKTVTDLMTGKFPSLGEFKHLSDIATGIAEGVVNNKAEYIMDYVKTLGGHLEEKFPDVIGRVFQGAREAVGTTTDDVLQFVPSWCSCAKKEAEEIKEKAFNTVAGEVRAKIKNDLIAARGHALPEHATTMIRERLCPIVDAVDARAVVRMPAREGVQRTAEPMQGGEEVQPLIQTTVQDALSIIGPHVGQQVADLMAVKFPGLDHFDHLMDMAKGLAEGVVRGKADDIMGYVRHLGGHAEENFPKVGTMLLQAVKAASGGAVDDLLQFVPSWCSCCKVPQAEDVKKKAYNVVSAEVQDKIKTSLKIAHGFDLPEHATKMIHERLCPMVDSFDVNARVTAPATVSAPQMHNMSTPAAS